MLLLVCCVRIKVCCVSPVPFRLPGAGAELARLFGLQEAGGGRAQEPGQVGGGERTRGPGAVQGLDIQREGVHVCNNNHIQPPPHSKATTLVSMCILFKRYPLKSLFFTV